MDQITDELNHGEGPRLCNLALPTSFIQAWPRLVACFTFMSNEDYRRAKCKLIKTVGSLYEGRKDLMRSLAMSPLDEKETVLPLGVAALLFKNMQRDINPASPNTDDVVSTYDEYYNLLVKSFMCPGTGWARSVSNNVHRKTKCTSIHIAVFTRKSLRYFAKKSSACEESYTVKSTFSRAYCCFWRNLLTKVLLRISAIARPI